MLVEINVTPDGIEFRQDPNVIRIGKPQILFKESRPFMVTLAAEEEDYPTEELLRMLRQEIETFQRVRLPEITRDMTEIPKGMVEKEVDYMKMQIDSWLHLHGKKETSYE